MLLRGPVLPRFGNEPSPAGRGWARLRFAMTARAPDDHTPDVRGLLAELGELVGDLGLDEPVAPARPAAVEPPAAPKPERARPRVRRSRLRVVQGAEDAAGEAAAPESRAAEGDAAAEPSPPQAAAPAPDPWPPAELPGAGPAAEGPDAEPIDEALAAEAPHSDEPAAELDDAGEDASTPLLPDDVAELAELAAAVAGPVGGADSSDLVPLWEPAAEDEPVTLVPLWEAFAPELDADPPRAWSLAAAMEVIEPAAPPAPPGGGAGRRRLLSRLRPRLFTLTTAAAVLVAAAVVVLTHLDLGHTSGPATPVVGQPFQVSMMRTVDATSASTVAAAPTLSHFPPHTAQVYMDVAYRNATQGDRLRLVIALLPPAGSGGNPVQVGDQTHVLPPGGEIAVTIQGPSTGFSPGEYTVTAFHDGHLEQSVDFSIDAAPAAGPTP